MTEYTAQLVAEKPHKRPNYLMIFGVLALMTLVEVTVAAPYPVLLVLLSLSKVALVALYYMHLRFDNGWFGALFLFPLPLVMLGLVVIVVALSPVPAGSEAALYGVCSFF
ncbi:MAG: cytochrome C oxidase subunit IV family protein [Anaerolineae bacterium]|nr:cytochrome C oxidase subunit IV family protein [Anaerolineae bacterium]